MKFLKLVLVVLLFSNVLVSCDLSGTKKTEEFLLENELQATDKDKNINSAGSGQHPPSNDEE